MCIIIIVSTDFMLRNSVFCRPSVILGVTNPFFSKTLEHWPHVIKVTDQASGKKPSQLTDLPCFLTDLLIAKWTLSSQVNNMSIGFYFFQMLVFSVLWQWGRPVGGILEMENQVYTCVNICNHAVVLIFFVGLYTKYKTHLSKDKLFAKLLQSKVYIQWML